MHETTQKRQRKSPQGKAWGIRAFSAKAYSRCNHQRKRTPLTWEEKIVFYADKIVTDRLVSLEERFRDLLERRKDIKLLLETTYEPTKALESEILTAAGISWDDLKSRFHEDQSL